MTLAQDPLALPRDAKLICLLLESLGVSEYDPLVVHQLLELGHRHMSDLLQDAQMYADHADRKDIVTVEDIRLAVENKVSTSFVNPPSKDVGSIVFELSNGMGLIRCAHSLQFMLELAERKNALPLPHVPEKYGLRLPVERHTLTAPNLEIVPQVRHHPFGY